MPKIKISQEDKQDYKEYLLSVGIFRAVKIFFMQVCYIIKAYMKLPKEKKEKAYICVYYNAADFPILTLRWN